MNAPELGQKVSISIGLVVAIIVMSFSLGGMVTGLLGLNGKIVDEVGGVRNDMNREVELLYKEIESNNKRVDRKIDNHESIYHNK